MASGRGAALLRTWWQQLPNALSLPLVPETMDRWTLCRNGSHLRSGSL